MKTSLNNFTLKKIKSKLKEEAILKVLGFKITKIEKGRSEGTLIIKKHHLQHNDFVHGGITATLADIVAGIAAATLLGPGQSVVTAEIKISYLNPFSMGKLQAIGWVLKAGTMLHFCEAEVWGIKRNNRVLLAKASASMAIVYQSTLDNKRKNLK